MEFAAHIRETDKQKQSVAQHCLETAALAICYTDTVNLENSAELAGLLHDIGKLTAAFNAYIHEQNDIHRGELDHSFAGAKFLAECAAPDKPSQKTAELLGRVILSHHGLHDWITDDSKDTYAIRTEKTAYYDEIMQNLRQTHLTDKLDTLFLRAVSEYTAADEKIKAISSGNEKTKQEHYGFYLGMSDSHTEAHFDLPALWKEMRRNMKKKLDEFAGKTDPISLQRQSISDRCAAFAAHDVKICKLIVPTGGGKTLSSLRFAIEYANTHPVQHIFYIAPFMSILEQNSDIIREIAGESAFLEHHSNMLAEVSGNDEQLQEYELRTEKWDSPVIATTMVQFLNALFSGKSAAVRRMHRLSRAVIIVDEVQSVPLKCVYLFNQAMNFLSQICGSTIVLCSATQPPFEQCTEFPLILDAQSSMTGDTETDFDVFRRTELVYQNRKGGYSYDEAAEFCREKFTENGSLLVVVNTKSAAKELYQQLRETDGAAVFHLSTAMCPKHRSIQIDKMTAMLHAHEPVICVTTQLIEAGVDISFGCVVRSLAGMDNAAQAAGRCNRSGEFHRVCPVYILELWEEKLDSLAEIKHAQDISRQMLDTPADTDFLGVNMQSSYFRKLFSQAQNRNFQNILRYPLPDDTDQDLINLLSVNHHRVKKYTHPKRRFSGQAFKTAGAYFSVIDSQTVSVIVPYNEDAKTLIAKLNSNPNPNETVRLLRKAQQYAVSIYAGTEHKLNEESALHTMPCGKTYVRILDARFYDENFGVTLEGGLHEVLCF